jgi:hypothetical protein
MTLRWLWNAFSFSLGLPWVGHWQGVRYTRQSPTMSIATATLHARSLSQIPRFTEERQISQASMPLSIDSPLTLIHLSFYSCIIVDKTPWCRPTHLMSYGLACTFPALIPDIIGSDNENHLHGPIKFTSRPLRSICPQNESQWVLLTATHYEAEPIGHQDRLSFSNYTPGPGNRICRPAIWIHFNVGVTNATCASSSQAKFSYRGKKLIRT